MHAWAPDSAAIRDGPSPPPTGVESRLIHQMPMIFLSARDTKIRYELLTLAVRKPNILS